MKFRNPQNGYEEEVSSCLSWLWVLLFGPLYWAVRGVWTHFALSVLLGMVGFLMLPLLFAWFIYPLLTYSILRTHYLRKGWSEVLDNSLENKVKEFENKVKATRK